LLCSGFPPLYEVERACPASEGGLGGDMFTLFHIKYQSLKIFTLRMIDVNRVID
jgi:hypothetical protein